MVKSMTGFGRAASEEGRDKVFSVEIKSVNHRYLDINTRMPKAMIPLEEKIRRKIKEYLNRGKVDLFINYKNYGKSVKNEFSDLKDDLSLSLVSRHPEVISIEEKEESLDEIWEEISNLLDISLKAMLEMREFEGDKLKEDIILKSNEIENLVSKIEEKSTVIVENYKLRLEDRLADILGKVEVDENRLAMEVAIFADKVAIDEEITRLKSHIKHLRETLELSEPIGRKLDFIMQEMNREANTIASKSTDLDITNNVIDIKNTLEKIREQVQNIE